MKSSYRAFANRYGLVEVAGYEGGERLADRTVRRMGFRVSVFQ